MLEPDPVPDARAPEERRIRAAERLGAVSEVFLCSGFPTQLLLSALLTGLGLPLRTADGEWSPAFVFALSLLDTVIIVALVLLFLAAHRERPRDVLLGTRSVKREAVVGLALVPAVFGVVVLVLALILTFAPQLRTVARNPLESMLQTRHTAVMFGVVVMMAGGVREEIQRGFILHRFQQYLGGGAVGVAIFSVLFGLGHLEQGADAAIATAILGATWGIIYLARRSIVAPMVSHAGFNLAQLVQYKVLR